MDAPSIYGMIMQRGGAHRGGSNLFYDAQVSCVFGSARQLTQAIMAAAALDSPRTKLTSRSN